MATEAATYLADLDDTKPANTELVAEGDDHLRLLKNVLQTTFPSRGVTDMAPITKTLNFVPGVEEVGALYVISGATTCTMPVASGLALGTHYWVWTADTDLTVTTSDATLVNGEASGTVKAGFGATVVFDGTNWILIAIGPGVPGADGADGADGIDGAGVGTGTTENTWAGELTGIPTSWRSRDTAFGYKALANLGMFADDNTAIGARALEVGSGVYGIVAIGSKAAQNVAASGGASSGGICIGWKAGDAATVLGDSVVIGVDAAGSSATIGGGAIVIGPEAAMRCVDPAGNIAIGSRAMAFAYTAVNSLAVGFYALEKLGFTSQPDCKENTGIGHLALRNHTVGQGQTALGYGALTDATSGDNCTALGRRALFNVLTYSNSTGVGAYSQVTGSNQVQLGDAATTTYAYGAVQNRSDERDKADVRSTSLGLDFILALRPVEFRWDYREDYGWGEKDGTKKRSRFHQGFIAQDVKQVLEDQRVDFGGFQDHAVAGGQDVMSLGYTEFIAPLVKAIQELAAEFAEYKRTHP